MDKWTCELRQLPDGTWLGYLDGEPVASGRERASVAKRLMVVWRERIGDAPDLVKDDIEVVA